MTIRVHSHLQVWGQGKKSATRDLKADLRDSPQLLYNLLPQSCLASVHSAKVPANQGRIKRTASERLYYLKEVSIVSLEKAPNKSVNK
jgi:hypothetical protein